MTLADLIRRFRVLANDQAQPHFWADADIVDWLNDAEAQACVRGRLLLEDADPTVCEIAVTPGQHSYPLHPAVYELVRVAFRPAGDGRESRLTIVSREWLDERRPDWRLAGEWSRWSCDERYLVQNETSVRIVPTPNVAGTLTLEAYRLPLTPMALPPAGSPPPVPPRDRPEIHVAQHEHLIQWALHKAFSIPDTESFDPQRSATAERAFTEYFGPMPDSDLRRITREDVVHHNKAVLP